MSSGLQGSPQFWKYSDISGTLQIVSMALHTGLSMQGVAGPNPSAWGPCRALGTWSWCGAGVLWGFMAWSQCTRAPILICGEAVPILVCGASWGLVELNLATQSLILAHEGQCGPWTSPVLLICPQDQKFEYYCSSLFSSDHHLEFLTETLDSDMLQLSALAIISWIMVSPKSFTSELYFILYRRNIYWSRKTDLKSFFLLCIGRIRISEDKEL